MTSLASTSWKGATVQEREGASTKCSGLPRVGRLTPALSRDALSMPSKAATASGVAPQIKRIRAATHSKRLCANSGFVGFLHVCQTTAATGRAPLLKPTPDRTTYPRKNLRQLLDDISGEGGHAFLADDTHTQHSPHEILVLCNRAQMKVHHRQIDLISF